jgi:hypothetical protein
LVDQCTNIHLLIDLCVKRREEHDSNLEKYKQSLETLGEEELAKAYFRVKTLCASI